MSNECNEKWRSHREVRSGEQNADEKEGWGWGGDEELSDPISI